MNGKEKAALYRSLRGLSPKAADRAIKTDPARVIKATVQGKWYSPPQQSHHRDPITARVCYGKKEGKYCDTCGRSIK